MSAPFRAPDGPASRGTNVAARLRSAEHLGASTPMGLSPGAAAAAMASGLVAITGQLSPWPPDWLNAAINEWLVWFTGLYVALVVALAVVERLRLRGVAVPTAGGN